MIYKNKFALCIPVAAASAPALSRQLTRIHPEETDYIEWRRDALPIEDTDTEKEMAALLTGFGVPVIYTHRLDVAKASENAKKLWQQSMARGAGYEGIAYIDIDLSCAALYFENQIETSCGLILSVHDFENCYDRNSLYTLAEKMTAYSAEVMKIAHTPKDDDRAQIAMRDVIDLNKDFDQPIIHVLMGEHGRNSRIYPEDWGGCLTYAVGDVATAKGQLLWQEIKKIRKNKKSN